MCWKARTLVVILGLMIGSIGLADTDGVVSENTIIPPDYFTFNPPEPVGSSFIDPAFGTRIQRMTNNTVFNQHVLGGYFTNSEICYFNIDGSYFLAQEDILIDGGPKLMCFIYSGITGARIKMLPDPKLSPYMIRWALTNKYKKDGTYVFFDPIYSFYAYYGNEIRLYDIRDPEKYQVLHRFAEYNEIGPAGGEGDLSDDGRYWVLDGNAKQMFAYDLVDDIKKPVSTFPLGALGSKGSDVGVDYAAVSPRGRFIVVSWGTDPGQDRYRGIEVYDLDWNFQRQIFPGIIHWELGIDAFGDEVVYAAACSQFDELFDAYGVKPGDFISIRLTDGHIRLLKKMPIWAHFVMSACNSVSRGPVIYVSISASRSSDPYQLWAPYWGEVIEIPTDGSGVVRRLTHHRSKAVPNVNDKYWTADINVNRQGTKMVFRSVFNNEIGDLYMFDIHQGDSNTSDNTPPFAPQNLRSETQTFKEIYLKWEPPQQAPDGEFAVLYKIFRDGQEIADCYDVKYRDYGLKEATEYRYDIFAIDRAGNKSEKPLSGAFSTLRDEIPPTLEKLQVQSRNEILLKFSEPVSQESAELTGNYQVLPPLAVIGAKRLDDSICVVLQTATIELGRTFQLEVKNVTDLSTAKNRVPAATKRTFRLLAGYYDDFNAGNADNWQLQNPTRWKIAPENDGKGYMLHLADPNYDSPADKLLGEYALLKQEIFHGSEFKLSLAIQSTEDLLINRNADYAIVFGYTDAKNYYYVQFHPYDVVINRIENGVRTIFQKYAANIIFDKFVPILIELFSDSLKVTVSGEELVTQPLSNVPVGQVGLGSFNDMAYFDNFNLEAITWKDTSPPNPPTGILLNVFRK